VIVVNQRPTNDDRSSLAAVGRVLAVVGGASFELQPVLDEIAAEARAICRADVCFCFLRDGDVFRFAASSGGSPEHWAHDRSHPETISRDSIVGRVALAGHVVQIPDVAADPEYRSSALSVGGYHTLMGVPIRTNEGMNGVLGVGRTAVETFSDDVIALVTVFADQAGIAMRLAGLLGTIDRQRTELARYAPQAAELLSSAEGEQLLAGHRREISALFADLRGFTAFANRLNQRRSLACCASTTPRSAGSQFQTAVPLSTSPGTA
jgi:GAF domain-containing protein